MNDKLEQIYQLYLDNGLLTEATSFSTFSNASDTQRQQLFSLGQDNGLFVTTTLDQFNTAWGGQSTPVAEEGGAIAKAEEGGAIVKAAKEYAELSSLSEEELYQRDQERREKSPFELSEKQYEESLQTPLPKELITADPNNPEHQRIVEQKFRASRTPVENLQAKREGMKFKLAREEEWKQTSWYKEEQEVLKKDLILNLETKINSEVDPAQKKYQEYLLSNARENNDMQKVKSFDMWLDDIRPENIREIQVDLTEEQIPQKFKDEYILAAQAYIQAGNDKSNLPSLQDWFKTKRKEYYDWFMENNKSQKRQIQDQAKENLLRIGEDNIFTEEGKRASARGEVLNKPEYFTSPEAQQAYADNEAAQNIGVPQLSDAEKIEQDYKKKYEDMLVEARMKKGGIAQRLDAVVSKMMGVADEEDEEQEIEDRRLLKQEVPLSMQEKLEVYREWQSWVDQQKISAEKKVNLQLQEDPTFRKDLQKLSKGIPVNEDKAAALINRYFGKYGIVANAVQNDGLETLVIQSGANTEEFRLEKYWKDSKSLTKRVESFIKNVASPALDINTDIADQAIAAQSLRKTPRIGEDGKREYFKWNLYEEGDKYKVVPTLFPTSEGLYDANPALWTEVNDLAQAKDIASMRGEMFTFNNKKDAQDFMKQWNNITPAEAVAIKHYAERGLDFLAHRTNLNYLESLQAKIDYYEKQQYLDDPRVREEILTLKDKDGNLLDPSSEEYKKAWISANTPFDAESYLSGKKTFAQASEGMLASDDDGIIKREDVNEYIGGTPPMLGYRTGFGKGLFGKNFGLPGVEGMINKLFRTGKKAVMEELYPEDMLLLGPEGTQGELEKLYNEKESFRESAFNEKLLRAQEDLDASLQQEMQKIVVTESDFISRAQKKMNDINTRTLSNFGVHLNQLPYVQPKNEEETIALINLMQEGVDTEAAYNTARTLKNDAQLFFNLKHDKGIKAKIDDGMDWYSNAISNGWKRGEAAKIMYQIMQHNSPNQLVGKVYSVDEAGWQGSIDISDVKARKKAASEIAEAYKSQSATTSRFMNRWSKADGFWEAYQVIADDPVGGSFALFAESMSQMGPYGMQILPQQVAVGAAIGGYGGALMGVRSAFATTSFIMEYTATIFDEMQKLKHEDGTAYSITNPDDVFAALSDQEFLDMASDRGVTRGIPISLIDFLSANLAGRLLRPSVLSSKAGQLARIPLEQVIAGPIAGSTGEFAAQVNEMSKGYRSKVDKGEVVLEGFGEIFGNISNLAINVAQDMNNISNIELADKLTDIDYVNSLPDSDEKISNWANKMFDLKKIDGETNQAIQENIAARKQAAEIAEVSSKKTLYDRVTQTDRSSKEALTKRLSQLIRAKERLSKSQATKDAYKDQIKEINEEIREISKTGRVRLSKDEVTISATPANQSTATKIKDFLISMVNMVDENPETRLEQSQREEQELQEKIKPKRKKETYYSEVLGREVTREEDVKAQVDVSEEIAPVNQRFFIPNNKGIKSRVTREEFLEHIEGLTDEEINKQVDEELLDISNVNLKDELTTKLEESLVAADDIAEGMYVVIDAEGNTKNVSRKEMENIVEGLDDNNINNTNIVILDDEALQNELNEKQKTHNKKLKKEKKGRHRKTESKETGVSSSILLSPDVSVNFNEVTAEMVKERGKKKKSQEVSEVVKEFAAEAIINEETVINENDVSLIDIAENKKEILVKGKPTEHNIVANEDGTFAVEINDEIVKDKLNSETEAITAYVEEVSGPTKTETDAVQEQSTTKVDADKQAEVSTEVAEEISTTKPEESTTKKLQDKKDDVEVAQFTQEQVEEINALPDEETQTISYSALEDIPAEFRDRARLVTEEENVTPPLPIGNYAVEVTGKELKDFVNSTSAQVTTQEKVESKKKVSSDETVEDVDTIVSDMMDAMQKQEDENYYVQATKKERPDFKAEESVELDMDESQMITQVMNKMKTPNMAVKINPTKKRTAINVDNLNERSEVKYEKLTPEQFEERFSNIPFIFSISDALTAGEVTNPNTGNKITNLRGGLGFHGQGNQNAAWANLKNKAKGLLDEAQDVYRNNKATFDAFWKANPDYDGLVPMAIVKMGEDAITSNEALFRVLNDNLTKIPKANKRKALTYLKNKELPSLIQNFNRLVEEGIKKGAKKATIDANKKKAKQLQNILDWIKDNKMTSIEDVVSTENLNIQDEKGNPVIALADRVVLINKLLIGKPNKHGESKKAPSNLNKNSTVRVLMGLEQEEGVGKSNPAANKKFKKFAPFLTMSAAVDLITEPAMKDVQQREIIAITGVDVKNPKVLQSGQDFTHPNYPEGVRGKSLGVLTESLSMQEVFPEAYNQVLKELVKYEKQQKKVTRETISSDGVPTQSGLSALELRGAKFESLNISDRNKLINFINTAFPQVRVYTDRDSFARIMQDETVRQYKKGDQVIYGMTLGRDIYINPDVHRSESAIYNTAIHEMGHVWLNTLEGTIKGKKLLNKGKALVEQTQEYQKYLKEFNGDKDRAAKEALAVLIGNKGETITDAALKSKFEEWLVALWNYIKETPLFKLSKDLTAQEVQNLTLDEFVGTALADIMSGKELKLTQAQQLNLRNPEVFFRAEDSVDEIIQRARLNNFADRHIREYLKRFTDLTDEQITEALAVPLEEDSSQIGLFTEYLPDSFANVEGGVNVGMETYTNIKEKLKEFAHTSERGRRTKKIQKTFSEIREQAQRLLTQERAYQRASTELQSQMRIDLDRAIGITENRRIGQQITRLQNLLADRRVQRLMKGKVQDIQSIKKEVRNFIRKNMPEAKYTKGEVNRLLNQVTKATEKNLMQVLNEVEDIIVRKKVQEVKNKIDKELKTPTTLVQSGRRKGKLRTEDQERLDNLNNDIVRVKKQSDLVDAVEKKQVELRARRAELIQKRSEGLTLDEQAAINVQIIDIDTALNYNEASLMENEDAVKLATYESVLQNLTELISEARLGYKADMQAAVERYNKLKGEFYKDITGKDIDFNDKQSIKDADQQLKRITNRKQKREKALGKMGVAYKAIGNFMYRHEAIEGMLAKISYMPAEMFEGKASEIILDRLDDSARRFRNGQYDAMRVLEEKAKEIWGEKRIFDRRRVTKGNTKTYRKAYQIALEDMALKTVALTTLNNPEVVGSVIVEEDVAALDKEIKEVEAKIERYATIPLKKRTAENIRLSRYLKELKQRREDTQEMFSQAQLYYLYNQYKDKANHPGFESTFGENYEKVMDEVIEKLDPKVKAWADWQVEEFFPSVYNKYNATYKNIYRTNMPWNKQYAGRLRRQVAGERDVMSSMIEGSNQYLTAVGGGSTKQRQANRQKIRYDVDGNLNLQTYINEMEFFSAYGENVRDIQKLMATPQIKDAISKTAGADIYSLLSQQLDKVMSYNIEQSENAIGLIDAFTGAFVTAKLGLNPVVMLKQLTSSVAFADYIGYRNWGKYAAQGLLQGIKNVKDGTISGKGFTWNEQWKELYNNSGMLQERYERSDISRVLENYVRDYEVEGITGKSYRKGQVNDLLMYMVKFGDKGGVMGSIPNYMYYKDEFAKKYPKKTEQEIIDLAVAKVERQISSTQQSNEKRYRDSFQTSGSSALRGLGAFTSSPRALLRKEMYALRELSRKMGVLATTTAQTGSIVKGYKAAKESGKGNWKQNLRTFLTYHYLIPVVFQWVAQGFGFKKDKEELDDLFFWTAVLGNINSLFILGDLSKMIYDTVTDKKWAGQTRNLPIFSHAANLSKNAKWWMQGKTEETREKWRTKFLIELFEGLGGATTGYSLPINNAKKWFDNITSLGESKDAHEAFLKMFNYNEWTQAKQRGEDPSKKKKKKKSSGFGKGGFGS
jgi:hypothetical protein